jgi:hypothetical protein
MTTGVLITILAVSVVGFVVVMILVARSGKHKHPAKKPGEHGREEYDKMTEAVDHIFNDEFREELRNHGRLYFDKIINENAMFLQQDLRLTSSQLNEYMKKEISKKLEEQFASYEQSMKDAQSMALETIQRTMRAAEEQQAQMTKQMEDAIAAEKERVIANFENNMADIVNHYLADAFGSQLDLKDQVGYILGEMEANKDAMKQDMLA